MIGGAAGGLGGTALNQGVDQTAKQAINRTTASNGTGSGSPQALTSQPTPPSAPPAQTTNP